MTLIIDPPSGWMYGFPKPVPQEALKSSEALKTWLLEQGYPKKDVEFAVKSSRYWEQKETTMKRIWCDWDIGEEDVIFETKQAAMAWLAENEYIQEMAEEHKQTVDACIAELFDQSYLQLQNVKVIK